jgi:hypothetical protein
MIAFFTAPPVAYVTVCTIIRDFDQKIEIVGINLWAHALNPGAYALNPRAYALNPRAHALG